MAQISKTIPFLDLKNLQVFMYNHLIDIQCDSSTLSTDISPKQLDFEDINL